MRAADLPTCAEDARAVGAIGTYDTIAPALPAPCAAARAVSLTTHQAAVYLNQNTLTHATALYVAQSALADALAAFVADERS